MAILSETKHKKEICTIYDKFSLLNTQSLEIYVLVATQVHFVTGNKVLIHKDISQVSRI